MEKLNFKEILEKLKNINLKELFKNEKTAKINQKQKISLFDSLFNLINSGIPITNSLLIMLYQTKNKNLKILLESILKDINKGKKLEDSFRSFPNIFNNFDIYMIKMGEVTGKVSSSLETIRNTEEANAELKTKIIGALIYPVIVISLSIAMIVGFMLFVIPRVQKMYQSAKVNLPSLTQSVIDISNFLQNNFIFIILGIILVGFGVITFKKHPKTKIYFDKWILQIPLFGNLIRKKILSIFSNTLGTLLQNGIMINEALDITKKSLSNAYYEDKIDKLSILLNEGIPLSELMGIKKLKDGVEDDCFPIELASIVKIGEQTGKLPGLLIKIGGKFNKEIDVIVKGLSTAIEPIVIIGVGIIVGIMVMAILLPFFNMVNVV